MKKLILITITGLLILTILINVPTNTTKISSNQNAKNSYAAIPPVEPPTKKPPKQ